MTLIDRFNITLSLLAWDYWTSRCHFVGIKKISRSFSKNFVKITAIRLKFRPLINSLETINPKSVLDPTQKSNVSR